MKAYMVYSRAGGSEESAVLVFAHSVKEARLVGHRDFSDVADDYLDTAARLIRDSEHLFLCADQKKLASDIPHVIDDPPTCPNCEFWGSKIGLDGYCEYCRDVPID